MGLTVTHRPANSEDAILMSAIMRTVEVDEVVAAEGRDPLGVLLDSVEASAESWAMEFDGTLACLWGVAPAESSTLLGKAGVVWLISSYEIERHPREFWRECLSVIPKLLDRWDVVYNAIDVRHEKAIRWALRLGFPLEDPALFGVQSRPFRFFKLRKENLACVAPSQSVP